MSKPATENLVNDLAQARLIGAATMLKAANYAKGDEGKQKAFLDRFAKQTKSAADGRQKLYDQFVAIGKEMSAAVSTPATA